MPPPIHSHMTPGVEEQPERRGPPVALERDHARVQVLQDAVLDRRRADRFRGGRIQVERRRHPAVAPPVARHRQVRDQDHPLRLAVDPLAQVAQRVSGERHRLPARQRHVHPVRERRRHHDRHRGDREAHVRHVAAEAPPVAPRGGQHRRDRAPAGGARVAPGCCGRPPARSPPGRTRRARASAGPPRSACRGRPAGPSGRRPPVREPPGASAGGRRSSAATTGAGRRPSGRAAAGTPAPRSPRSTGRRP